VLSRSIATQLVERLALIALACGSILVILPAVLRAVATDWPQRRLAPGGTRRRTATIPRVARSSTFGLGTRW